MDVDPQDDGQRTPTPNAINSSPVRHGGDTASTGSLPSSSESVVPATNTGSIPLTPPPEQGHPPVAGISPTLARSAPSKLKRSHRSISSLSPPLGVDDILTVRGCKVRLVEASTDTLSATSARHLQSLRSISSMVSLNHAVPDHPDDENNGLLEIQQKIGMGLEILSESIQQHLAADHKLSVELQQLKLVIDEHGKERLSWDTERRLLETQLKVAKASTTELQSDFSRLQNELNETTIALNEKAIAARDELELNHKQVIERHTLQVDGLRDEITTLKQQLELQSGSVVECETLKKDLYDLRASHAALQASVLERDETEDVAIMLTEADSPHNEQLAFISDLENRLDDAEARAQASDQLYHEVKASLDRATRSEETLSARLEQVTSLDKAEIRSLEVKLRKIEADLTDSRTQCVQERVRVESLEDDLAKVIIHRDQIQTSCERLEASLAKENNARNVLDEEKELLKGQLGEAFKRHAAAEERFDAESRQLQNEVVTRDRRILHMEQNIDGLELRNHELTQEIGRLNREAQTQAEDVTKLRTLLQDSEQRHDNLLAKIETTKALHDQISLNLAEQKAANDSLRGQYEHVQNDRAQASDKVAILEDNNEELCRQLSEARRYIALLDDYGEEIYNHLQHLSGDTEDVEGLLASSRSFVDLTERLLQVEVYEPRNQFLRATKENLHQLCDRLDTVTTTLSHKILELRGELRTSEESASTLQATLNTVEPERARVEGDLATRSVEISNLRQELDAERDRTRRASEDHQAALLRMQQMEGNLSTEREQWREQRAGFNQRYDSAKNEIATLKEKLHNTSEMYARINMEHASCSGIQDDQDENLGRLQGEIAELKEQSERWKTLAQHNSSNTLRAELDELKKDVQGLISQITTLATASASRQPGHAPRLADTVHEGGRLQEQQPVQQASLGNKNKQKERIPSLPTIKQYGSNQRVPIMQHLGWLQGKQSALHKNVTNPSTQVPIRRPYLPKTSIYSSTPSSESSSSQMLSHLTHHSEGQSLARVSHSIPHTNARMDGDYPSASSSVSTTPPSQPSQRPNATPSTSRPLPLEQRGWKAADQDPSLGVATQVERIHRPAPRAAQSHPGLTSNPYVYPSYMPPRQRDEYPAIPVQQALTRSSSSISTGTTGTTTDYDDSRSTFTDGILPEESRPTLRPYATSPVGSAGEQSAVVGPSRPNIISGHQLQGGSSFYDEDALIRPSGLN